MTTTISVYNAHCYIPDSIPVHLLKALGQEMAFKVEGAEHAKSYRMGYWDGREHLLKKSRNKPMYYFPSGLLPMLLKDAGLASEFDFVDCRRPLLEHQVFRWVGNLPRAYQEAAASAALEERGPGGITTGRGMLNLPIRSGKTLTASLITYKLGLPTLFVAPSDILLHQTAAAFRENLGNKIPLGLCGDGHWDPNFITVATVQTLISRPEAYAAELQHQHDILFQDEAHHLEGPAWRIPILQSDARYKLGLSATIFANKDIPAERSAIWLQACTGPILHRVSMQRLFREGHLVPPHILWYTIDKPKGFSGLWYADAYNKLIECSEFRNSAIADLAEEAVKDRKLRVLIDTGRKKQMHRLHEMLRARGVKVEQMHGGTKGEVRMNMIADFRINKIQCIVGTVLGEGVDIPELEVVINAEGQKSKEAIIQRMRNLTPPPDGRKLEALFIDFDDVIHPKLHEHSAQRLAMYQGTRGFRVSLNLAIDLDGRFHLPPG